MLVWCDIVRVVVSFLLSAWIGWDCGFLTCGLWIWWLFCLVC